MTRITVPIHGMQGCYPPTIEKVFRRIPGVQEAYANPATEEATVTYDESAVDMHTILDRFNRSGYRAHAVWLRFAGNAPEQVLKRILGGPGVIHFEATPDGPACLVHPEQADLPALRATLEEAGCRFLGTEEPGA